MDLVQELGMLLWVFCGLQSSPSTRSVSLFLVIRFFSGSQRSVNVCKWLSNISEERSTPYTTLTLTYQPFKGCLKGEP